MRGESEGVETHLFCHGWIRCPGRLEQLQQQQQQEEVMKVEVRRSWTGPLTLAAYQETDTVADTLLSPPIPRDKTAALPLLPLRPRLSHAL